MKRTIPLLGICTWLLTLFLVLPVSAGTVTEDRNKDGKPDVWCFYSENGDLERVEMDDDFDGAIDAWHLYRAGRIDTVIRDTNGDGKQDTWDHFQDGLRTRQEQDQDGDGAVDLWAGIGENGRIIAIKKDLNRDGKPDL